MDFPYDSQRFPCTTGAGRISRKFLVSYIWVILDWSQGLNYKNLTASSPMVNSAAKAAPSFKAVTYTKFDFFRAP